MLRQLFDSLFVLSHFFGYHIVGLVYVLYVTVEGCDSSYHSVQFVVHLLIHSAEVVHRIDLIFMLLLPGEMLLAVHHPNFIGLHINLPQ